VKDASPRRYLNVFRKSGTVASGPSFVAVTLGSMLPSVSILALYHIKSISIRIYALMGITFFFALGLKFLAKAKSMEVFALTAAYDVFLYQTLDIC
jgi:hypothetical protein